MDALGPGVLEKLTKVSLDLIHILLDGREQLFLLLETMGSIGLLNRSLCKLISLSGGTSWLFLSSNLLFLFFVWLAACSGRLCSLAFTFIIRCEVILQL